MFISNYLCVVCDTHQEDHLTAFESELERRSDERSIGKDYLPLAEAPQLQEIVFGKELYEKVIVPRLQVSAIEVIPFEKKKISEATVVSIFSPYLIYIYNLGYRINNSTRAYIVLNSVESTGFVKYI